MHTSSINPPTTPQQTIMMRSSCWDKPGEVPCTCDGGSESQERKQKLLSIMHMYINL